tara:strand:- start:12 stop:305 length:294 start_codon:yes stop_codon:yes gene_type:complete
MIITLLVYSINTLSFDINLVGFLAGFCTTIAFIPQVVKVWKTKSTKDISLSMFAIFTFGVLCWTVYGLLIFNLPMIVANAITLILASAILIAKIKFS